VVIGLSSRGPASNAGIEAGDVIHSVGETRVRTLAQFYRAVWALGDAGCEVPLIVLRERARHKLSVTSADRTHLFKGPRLH
jgi:S1-C subfamily serine protease